jgi:type II secretory pathway component PulF
MGSSTGPMAARGQLYTDSSVKRPTVLLVGYLIVTVLLTIIAIGALVIAPQFARVFADFRGDLPRFTLILVASATYWGVLPLISAIIVYDLWRRKNLYRGYKMFLTITLVVFSIFAIAIIPVSVIVLYLPVY